MFEEFEHQNFLLWSQGRGGHVDQVKIDITFVLLRLFSGTFLQVHVGQVTHGTFEPYTEAHLQTR